MKCSQKVLEAGSIIQVTMVLSKIHAVGVIILTIISIVDTGDSLYSSRLIEVKPIGLSIVAVVQCAIVISRVHLTSQPTIWLEKEMNPLE